MKVAVVIGTRPEAIKMAPVIKELERRKLRHVVIVTAQHRDMLDQELAVFGIQPQRDLNIMQPDQDLFHTTVQVLEKMKNVLEEERPDVVLVQGDTTTTFAASLAAYYLRIPVGHVEAGLRTWNKFNPYPEEVNRQLTSRIADFHFAPTAWARENLLKEGVDSDHITVTGNTVIDALLMIVDTPFKFTEAPLSAIDFSSHRVILLTAHRRENFGQPLRNILMACRHLLEKHDDLELVYPVHPNPNVREAAHEILADVPRAHLVEPLDYRLFVQVMNKSYLILTDSGGVQEEAPSLGKPVLVLRSTTERPEAINAGTALLVGTESAAIIREVERLLNNPDAYKAMAARSNPYGDGKAAGRIVDVLQNNVHHRAT